MATEEKVFNKACEYCFEDFETSKSFARFCSDHCRVYYNRTKRSFKNKHGSIYPEQLNNLKKVKDELVLLAESPVSDIDNAINDAIGLFAKSLTKMTAKKMEHDLKFQEYLLSSKQKRKK